MHDDIIAYLRNSPGGASSENIAAQFLKFKNADPLISHRTVQAILGQDQRCTFGKDNLWHAVKGAACDNRNDSILNIPWAAVHIVSSPNSENRLYYVAIWTILPEFQFVSATWLIDPATLPHEEQEFLVSVNDAPFGNKPMEDLLSQISTYLDDKVPVFISSRSYTLLSKACAMAGVSFTDNIVCLQELMTAAGTTVSRPLTLENCAREILGDTREGLSFYQQADRFAQCIAACIETMRGRGIETQDDIDKCNEPAAKPPFEGKDFTYSQILSFRECPGVYAFKDKEERYLYIGKAKNLRRRLLSYFRDTGESPGKLDRLRKEAHSLLTHQCGSELETLILEYRLIKKHSPLLNTRIDVNERKGTYAPLNDCIVLLPHFDPEKGMSFWFRKNQKILMKPFDTHFSDSKNLISEIENFFFTEKLAAEATDFPEQEIVYRWVRQKQDSLSIVPVGNMANAEEIFEGIRSYWKDIYGADGAI